MKMSRTVTIKGSVKIHFTDLAQEAIRESGIQGIRIVNNQFQFSGYDHYDGQGKTQEITSIEEIYQRKHNDYIAYLEEEEKRKAEEERIRIEEEKRVFREEQKEKIIENAKKQGYTLKKEVTADNKIKLVLQRRVY